MTRLESIKEKLKNGWGTHGWVDTPEFSKMKTEDVRDIDHEMKWLIARVERLETALKKLEWECGPTYQMGHLFTPEHIRVVCSDALADDGERG